MKKKKSKRQIKRERGTIERNQKRTSNNLEKLEDKKVGKSERNSSLFEANEN